LNNSITAIEAGEVLHDKDTNEIDNTIVESSDIVINQKAGDSTKVSLYNSFELLQNDCEHIIGEAKQADMETTHITIDKVLPVNMNVEEISLERENITILDPKSPAQCSKVGRLLFPSDMSVSASHVLDPTFDKASISAHLNTETPTIITPITNTDEILGPDKGRLNRPAITKNNTEACRKSEKILSKLWADDLDIDHATDNAMHPVERSLDPSSSNGSSVVMKSVSKGANNHGTAALKSVSILRTQYGDLVDEETDMSDDQE